jgi:hypothetical protein
MDTPPEGQERTGMRHAPSQPCQPDIFQQSQSDRAGSFYLDKSSPIYLESDLQGNPQWLAQGWERRFVADSQRLAEYVALYAELGYEVAHEPVLAEEIGPECSGCRLVACRQFVTLYTRRPARGGAGQQ